MTRPIAYEPIPRVRLEALAQPVKQLDQQLDQDVSHPGGSSDELARAVFDPGYQSLGRYLSDGPDFLNREGRVFFGSSSTSGDIRELTALASRHGLQLIRSEAAVLPDVQYPGFSLELYQAIREP